MVDGHEAIYWAGINRKFTPNQAGVPLPKLEAIFSIIPLDLTSMKTLAIYRRILGIVLGFESSGTREAAGVARCFFCFA
jgi:hypothetical protein